MFRTIFKNLEKSDLAREAVNERMSPLIEKFPELDKEDISVTLSMENSPQQSGLDQFKVKLQVHRGIYRGLILEKSASNLYVALAYTVERLHERVSRFSSRWRRTQRSRRRMARYAATEEFVVTNAG